jgi:Family of unknown function (DUF6412)
MEVSAALSNVLAVLGGLWQVTGHLLLSPYGLHTLAVTVLAAVALLAARACLADGARLAQIGAAVPLVGRAAALREKSWRAAYGKQRDPDAAGRPRPRAPSAAPAAATS